MSGDTKKPAPERLPLPGREALPPWPTADLMKEGASTAPGAGPIAEAATLSEIRAHCTRLMDLARAIIASGREVIVESRVGTEHADLIVRVKPAG